MPASTIRRTTSNPTSRKARTGCATCRTSSGSRALNLGSNWCELVKNRILSKHAAQQVRRHERNLQMLRTRLQYLANRREDRLLFDFQKELASQLGLVTTKHWRASEQLMHSFYRSSKFVRLINGLLKTKSPTPSCYAYCTAPSMKLRQLRANAKNKALFMQILQEPKHCPHAEPNEPLWSALALYSCFWPRIGPCSTTCSMSTL